jgi:hypothetical protein
MAQRVSCTFSAGRKTRQDIAASARCAARRRAPRRVMRAKRGPRRRAATLPGRAGGAGRASARARLHAPQQARKRRRLAPVGGASAPSSSRLKRAPPVASGAQPASRTPARARPRE